MKEKDLLIQLKKLKGVRPDREWKKTNRELLYSQISAQADDNVKIGWFKSLERQLSIAFLRVSQPAMTVLLIIIFIFGGSVLSLRAARNTTPGDSMYIAKILSEKTQYALTFNEKSKAKLGLEFAGNRVKEINKVLAQTETVDTNKAETVEKLKSDFKKEISEVKDRLARINDEQKNTATENVNKGDESSVAEEELAVGEEDAPVFSAAFDRDDKGVQIAESDLDALAIGDEDKEDLSDPVSPATTSEESAAGTSSEAVSEEAPVLPGDPGETLLEAEEFLDNEDYSATLNKLNEAGDAIEQVNKEPGEVLGVEETAASSTEE